MTNCWENIATTCPEVCEYCDKLLITHGINALNRRIHIIIFSLYGSGF